MLPTSARTALLAASLFAGCPCAETSPSSGVVVAPIAPTPSPSGPAVDRSTAAANRDASVADDGAPGETGAPTRFRSCHSSGDCVAVPRVGCCHNGWNEAVAASQKDAYAASFVCPEAHPICAMFIVRDTRVPECDAATHLCTLVARR
jgi:hypothetical protein